MQPELGDYPIRVDESLRMFYFSDTFLWTKCIKTKIYQKALNKFGEEKYSRYMVIWEDVVATYFLYNTAETMKYIGKYGTLHIKTRGSGSKTRISKLESNSYLLYLIDTVIDFGKDTLNNRKVLITLIKDFLGKKELKEILNYKEYNKNILISCVDKLLSMKYLSNDDKERIRKKVAKLNLLKK